MPWVQALASVLCDILVLGNPNTGAGCVPVGQGLTGHVTTLGGGAEVIVNGQLQ